MQTNYSVAELTTLLSQHGIALPAAPQAEFDDTSSDLAAVATAPASPIKAAVAENEPEEAVIGGDGYIRCTNCHTHLALFAVTRTAANAVPAAPAVNAIPAAPAANAAVPASAVLPSPAASNSRSSRWYAVTVGRQIGVFYGKWDEQINDLVSGVSLWNAPRFATEGEARAYFARQAAAGKAYVANA